ncbi:hypothetical protein BJX65DRAFT_306226 [Aspergillus insuetus]
MCKAELEALKRHFRHDLLNGAEPYPIIEELSRIMDIEQEERESTATVVETHKAKMRRLEALVEDKSRMIDRLNQARAGKFCYVSVLVDRPQSGPRNLLPDTCVILVCANVDQLEPLYSTSRTTEFVRGFNSNPLAKFVDVGGTRENAEAKLHAALRNNFGNYHCRHVVFCGSGNDNHAAILWRLNGAPAISLVEGRPFPPGMSTVARTFKTVKFNKVFMSPDFLPQETPTSGEGEPDLPVDRVEEHVRVHLNRNGQRVDSLIAHSAKDTLNLLMSRKLCRDSIIRGVCQGQGNGRCNYIHGDSGWSRQQQLDMLHISRSRCCFAGLDCRNPECLYGHRCPYGDECKKKAKCSFPPGMHVVDCNIMKTL